MTLPFGHAYTDPRTLPPCKKVKLGKLVRVGKCVMHFQAPSAGTLAVRWRTLRGAKLASATSKASKPKQLSITVKLTNAGKRYLRVAKKTAWVRVTVAFTPKRDRTVSRSQKFRYRR